MSLTAWIIFFVIIGGIIFLNIKFFGENKKPNEKQKDVIPGITVKKEQWQKRNLFNGFVYYVLAPLLWAIGTIVLVDAIA